MYSREERNTLIGFALLVVVLFAFMVWGMWRITVADNKAEARCEDAGGVWYDPRGDGICLDPSVVVP